MSYNNRKGKVKCKWGGGEFNALPRRFTRSEVLRNLSPYACKLFLDLEAQYNGFNNGDLSISWKIMQGRRWRSKATLERKTRELLDVGVITRTRQGHRRQCHLYAITLYDIDECKGKLDVARTSAPLESWLKHEPARPLGELQAKFKAQQQRATDAPEKP